MFAVLCNYNHGNALSVVWVKRLTRAGLISWQLNLQFLL